MSEDEKLAMKYFGWKDRPTLDELAHRETVPELWSDKRSPRKTGEIYVCHDYLQLYDRLFSPMRDRPIRFMEIGLNVGASVKLWLEYFTEARIFGVDIVPFEPKVQLQNIGRFIFEQGDQFDIEFWNRFKEKHSEKFDVIIDDGCHFSGPIITSFACLWPHVKPGGLYIVEDLSEVKNPASHTAGYQDQLEWSTAMLGNLIIGTAPEISEAIVMKDLLVLRKKP